MKAIRDGTVVAESDETVVGGNRYFPREALRTGYFKPSDDGLCGASHGARLTWSSGSEGSEQPGYRGRSWRYTAPRTTPKTAWPTVIGTSPARSTISGFAHVMINAKAKG